MPRVDGAVTAPAGVAGVARARVGGVPGGDDNDATLRKTSREHGLLQVHGAVDAPAGVAGVAGAGVAGVTGGQ